MKIEHLQEFLALAKTNNYSRTAEQFFISQSTLSKHIAALEAELGCDLIDHDSYGLKLTEFGRFAMDEFSAMLASYENVLMRADQMKNGVSGKLVIGVLYYQANRWIRPIIQFFESCFPDVSVKTVSGQPDQLFDGVAEGRFDAAFLFHNTFMHPDTEKYQFTPVFQEPVIALFSPENALCDEQHKITLDQLSGQKLLRNEDGNFMRQFNDDFTQYLRDRQIILGESVILENIDFLTSTILETDSFLIQGIHIKEFHPDLNYAKIVDLPSMETGILTRKSSSNILVQKLLETVPMIKSRQILSSVRHDM